MGSCARSARPPRARPARTAAISPQDDSHPSAPPAGDDEVVARLRELQERVDALLRGAEEPGGSEQPRIVVLPDGPGPLERRASRGGAAARRHRTEGRAPAERAGFEGAGSAEQRAVEPPTASAAAPAPAERHADVPPVVPSGPGERRGHERRDGERDRRHGRRDRRSHRPEHRPRGQRPERRRAAPDRRVRRDRRSGVDRRDLAARRRPRRRLRAVHVAWTLQVVGWAALLALVLLDVL